MQNTNKVIEVELWRDVKGYNGAYQVSSMGRIRSTNRIIILNNGNQRHVSGHILSLHDNGLGYMQVNMMDTDHKLHAQLVHRLVLSAFLPLSDAEASMAKLTDVDHINNDRADNRLSNLRRCTHADNLRKEHRMNQIRHACVLINRETGEIELRAKSIRQMAELLSIDKSNLATCIRNNKPLPNGLIVKRDYNNTDNDTDKQADTAKEVA
ncbi:NUMOD4 domain-containing protein [Lactiplantibacillus plantarum]|uniref:NUMOD4 domain-containing protein n=1 Tax=Lactiplantibacillus plantarum TaxID=1590 RepID=UPI0023785D02|nr:NUMOD4 domain-containing protein [Lactiplantibacillus plantarum]WDQ20414.1 NUMOD4 domain-containing protein [Lactiplantibacillus plantarum]